MKTLFSLWVSSAGQGQLLNYMGKALGKDIPPLRSSRGTCNCFCPDEVSEVDSINLYGVSSVNPVLELCYSEGLQKVSLSIYRIKGYLPTSRAFHIQLLTPVEN